jgi:hypothetical protein
MNIYPTNKAYNFMRKRCDTEYFVQCDEDMELFPDSIKLFYSFINKDNNCFLTTFKLIDEYLGIGKNKIIDCVKLYNNNIMQKYPTLGDGDIPISSVDKMWHKSILEDKFTINQTQNIAGTHAKNRNGFDLMLRFCKSTKSMINNEIKINSGDLCRLIKPLNKLKNLEEITNLILCHYHILKFDINKFNHNKKILLKRLSTYINKSSLELYDLTEKYVLFPDFEFKFDIKNFFKLINYSVENNSEIFCLIGIINTLFDNYEYSYSNYPYDIFNYFNMIFNFKICFILDKPIEQKIKLIFDKYKFVDLFFVYDEEISFDCVVKIINEDIFFNDVLIQEKILDDLPNFLFTNVNRKNKYLFMHTKDKKHIDDSLKKKNLCFIIENDSDFFYDFEKKYFIMPKYCDI